MIGFTATNLQEVVLLKCPTSMVVLHWTRSLFIGIVDYNNIRLNTIWYLTIQFKSQFGKHISYIKKNRHYFKIA